MASPSLGDLRYLFFGGGSAAEYQALKDFAAAGINVNDLLAVAEGGGGVDSIDDVPGLTAALAGKADDAEITAINASLATLATDQTAAYVPTAVCFALDRDIGSAASQVLVTGQIALTQFVASCSIPAATTMAFRVGTPAAATITTIRYALYRVEANGDCTLLACTANDTALLTGTSTTYPKSFAADGTFGTGTTANVVKGTQYAAALLVVATTLPGMVSAGTLRDTNWNLDAPRICGSRTSSVLEATILNANITATTRRLQCRIS